MYAMTGYGLVGVIALTACARVGGPADGQDAAGAMSDVATGVDAVDARDAAATDGRKPAMRDDGCPVHPGDLTVPCEGYKICRYEQCEPPDVPAIIYYKCWQPFEMPAGWYQSGAKPCYLENGPDGCPLGYVGAGQPCTEPGKVCRYDARCKYGPVTGQGTCVAYDGGYVWREDRYDCPK